jgi:hypothetical protein
MGVLMGRRHKQTEEIFKPETKNTGLKNQGRKRLARALKKPLKRRKKRKK